MLIASPFSPLVKTQPIAGIRLEFSSVMKSFSSRERTLAKASLNDFM